MAEGKLFLRYAAAALNVFAVVCFYKVRHSFLSLQQSTLPPLLQK